MRADIIVPFRGGCPNRERAWRWLRDRYAAEGWDGVEAPAPEGPWCKALAVNPAVEASNADIIAVVDADVWTDGLATTVDVVASGKARWAIPHKKLYRLDEEGTAAFMAGEPTTTFAEPPDHGVWGGGIVVAERSAMLEAPLDARFTSWGQEDTSWALALECLCGQGRRMKADLWHLWHPPQERLYRRKGSEEGLALHQRYRKARYNREAMCALLEEARCPSPA